MHKNKQILFIIIFVLLGSLFFLIKKNHSKEYNIIFITKTLNQKIPFWDAVKKGMETATKEYVVNLSTYGPPNESDPNQQNQYIIDAIAKKPDAIILAALNNDLGLDICNAIVDAGIILITVDSDINSDIKSSYIGTDNYEAGKYIGVSLSKIVGGNDKVAIINFEKGTSTSIDRENGFFEALKTSQLPIVLGPYYCDSNFDTALAIAKNVISDHPDLEAFVGLNGLTTAAATIAVKEAGMINKIKIIGTDATPTIIKGLEEGIIDTVIVQKPFNMGYLSLQTAVDKLNGKKVEPFINTGVEIVNKQNMYSKEIQKLLFLFD